MRPNTPANGNPLADSGEHEALLLRVLDLLSVGIVACDASARLAFGNRLIDEMVDGLHPGQAAQNWSQAYGLTDTAGRPYPTPGDIPLVRALNRYPIGRLRMRQRCGDDSVELLAHARAVEAPDGGLIGAVGVFIPIPCPGHAAGTPRRWRRETRRYRVGELDLRLVAAAVDLVDDLDTAAPASDDPLAAQVAEYVTARLTEPIRLPQVAAAFGYNPSYFTALLSRRSGESLMQLALRIRLTEACRLLEITDLPISGVAARTGPWGAEYFARAFRRRHGCSPSAWRRQRRAARDRLVTAKNIASFPALER